MRSDFDGHTKEEGEEEDDEGLAGVFSLVCCLPVSPSLHHSSLKSLLLLLLRRLDELTKERRTREILYCACLC